MTAGVLRRQAGFSALEVLVALAVLAVAILGTLAAVSSSFQLERATSSTELANRVLERELERYRALPLSNVVPTILAADPPGEPYLVKTVGGELREGELTIEVLTEAQARDELGLAAVPDLDGNDDPDVTDFGTYDVVVPLRFTLRWSPSPGLTRTVIARTLVYRRTTASEDE